MMIQLPLSVVVPYSGIKAPISEEACFVAYFIPLFLTLISSIRPQKSQFLSRLASLVECVPCDVFHIAIFQMLSSSTAIEKFQDIAESQSQQLRSMMQNVLQVVHDPHSQIVFRRFNIVRILYRNNGERSTKRLLRIDIEHRSCLRSSFRSKASWNLLLGVAVTWTLILSYISSRL